MIATPVISIHAPRVGSDLKLAPHTDFLQISIHAPRVGSDGRKRKRNSFIADFNPRSPCGERRSAQKRVGLLAQFQSTLPVWGATTAPCPWQPSGRISIHAPRVGSDRQRRQENPFQTISIHAPRVGSDSTISVKGRYCAISIHAPRVGSDWMVDGSCCGSLYFNPRSPCGERLPSHGVIIVPWIFQSTLPVWGATGRRLLT